MGLALSGFKVYINTIATFLTRRCFEQNVINAGLHNLNIRFIASGGGCVYAPLGPTHIANDDIAIMNTIPNMTIISVADKVEMKKMMEQTLKYNGPIYIRLGKGNDPIITSENKKFQIGKACSFFKGKKIALISTGITTKICIDVAKKLNNENYSAQVLHFPTIKPFDEKYLMRKIKFAKKIIVVEEHSIIGGLHSIVSGILTKMNINRNINYLNFSLPDIFISDYGKQNDVLKKYGISFENVYTKIINL